MAWRWLIVGILIAAGVVGLGGWWLVGMDGMTEGHSGADTMGMSRTGGSLPAVTGFYEGRRISFVHTEASNAEVAGLLTDMMDSAVLVVPELAEVPKSALGTVYVFGDGVVAEAERGPMGFQPDVFDSAPGDLDYTPLREVVVVRWTSDADARVLTSDLEVETALAGGQIEAKPAGAVVNMPFLTWPGGSR